MIHHRPSKSVKRLPSYSEIEKQAVYLNLAESPLKWLASRKDAQGHAYLTAQEILAGERFRNDFTFAGLTPRMGVNFENISSKGYSPLHFTEGQLAAKARFEKASEKLGQELASLAYDFLGLEFGLEEIEQKHRWPARSAKVVIKLMLSQLARHYGLAP
jgi:hypothetical protein